MKLKPLCRLDMTYTHLSTLSLAGGEVHMYGVLEGSVTGDWLSGTVAASNYPVGRPDGVFVPDLRGVITTPEGALLEVSMQGYGVREAEGAGRRVTGYGFLRTEAGEYRRLNNVVAAFEGVLDAARPERAAKLNLEVYESIWEPFHS